MALGMERGAIIALQGDPCTGKTTIAKILGRALKLTTIHLDDILDFMAPVPRPTRSSLAPDALFTRAFDILAVLVKSQTLLGLSVVVDSPLSRRSHLDKLLELVTGEAPAALRLLIVHCVPQTDYIRGIALTESISSRYKDKWYKPQEFSKRDYEDSHIPTRLVSRLVVETSSHLTSLPSNPLVELVRRMSISSEDQIEDLQSWKKSVGIRPSNIKRPRDWDDGSSVDEGRPRKRARLLQMCTDGHCVKVYHKEGEYRIKSTTCEACDKKIEGSEAAYSCIDCHMAIHEACAERTGAQEEYNPEKFPKFIHRELLKVSYYFPKQDSCSVCTQDGKEFSYDCGSCLFQSHLKSAVLPTVLRHNAHPQHPLYFWAMPISDTTSDNFQCYACRDLANYTGFSSTDGSADYHPECAFSPQVFKKHLHGGHQHNLSLVFHRKEKLENYFCHACDDTLNPDAWFYACFKCKLEMHLDCTFKEFD